MFIRPMIRDFGGLQRETAVGDGLLNPRITTDPAAGNLTISANAIKGGIVRYTGAAAAVTYTTTTGALIDAALPGMELGDCRIFRLVNTAAQPATVAGGVGVSAIAGNLVVNATGKEFALVKTGVGTFDLFGL